MTKRDRIGPRCWAYREDGKICGRPATQYSPTRGLFVCPAHRDPPEPRQRPDWTYQVCPKCKHLTETRKDLALATHCPKCDSPYVTPGPSKEEVGR